MYMLGVMWLMLPIDGYTSADTSETAFSVVLEVRWKGRNGQDHCIVRCRIQGLHVHDFIFVFWHMTRVSI